MFGGSDSACEHGECCFVLLMALSVDDWKRQFR